MRSGDTQRRDVIRYLRASLGNREIDLKRTLSDDEVVGVIQTQIKQRSDAAELFRQGHREDLALNEEQQAAILSEYLPAQMSEDELTEYVRLAAEELGVSGASDMGKLMGRLTGELKGRADGRTLSRIAREELVEREASTSGPDQ